MEKKIARFDDVVDRLKNSVSIMWRRKNKKPR